MAFTKITAAGIGSTETVTLDGLSVINNGSFGGNLTVGGVLTYEDVTNVDSVGLITARNGIVVGSGITLSKDGDIFATGVTTATKFVGDGSELTGVASTDNIRTNTNATFLQNVNVSGTTTATTFIGNLTGNATSADTVDTTSSNNDATHYVTFVDSSGSQSGETLRTYTNLLFNPNSGLLQATSLTGTLPPAEVSDQNNTSTGYFDLPVGTTGERPGSPAEGMIRFNTTLTQTEEYRSSQWHALSNKFTVTGGTISTAGGYNIHTFTSSGTLTVEGASASGVDYIVVAGGGGGGGSGAGGGGAGGVVVAT